MIKIIMDSGKEYTLKRTNYTKFKSMICNGLGIMFNFLVEIEDIIINPSHISSVEIE